MKNGLQEIITSGRSPGIFTGTAAVDPESVMAKAPKALAQMERGERRSKRGISARDISRHFGMSVDFIKHTWSRPFKKKAVVNAVVLALLWHCHPVKSADITPGTSFTDGQTVSASQLALLASGTINTSFYTGKAIDPTPLSSDYLLVYSPTLLGFYKTTAGSLFSANYQQTVTGATPGTPALTDLFPFFNSNTNLYNTTFSNLIQQISIYENMASWQFAPTNANSSNTNVFVLSEISGIHFGAFQPTSSTNQSEFLTWRVSGVPQQVSLLTLETTMSGDQGTNLSVPYVFQEIWSPWSFYGYQTNIYGTNGSGLPLSTNAWGFTTNFPIQHIFLPNTFNPTNNTQTLTDQDTVPIFATGQFTNTTFTLQALYEYLTNRNALPPYTVARIQFSGIPASYTIGTNNTSTNNLYPLPSSLWTTPTAVSFLFTAGSATQLPSTPQVTSNQIYYAVQYADIPNSIRLYTNYATALLQTNWITYTGPVGGTKPTMYWLTNYTSFNADVIQTVSGTSANPGYYQIWFRTPSANSLYYVSGISQGLSGSVGNYLNLDYRSLPNTNFVPIVTSSAASVEQLPLNEILINPQ